jgi:hypothetical protein
MWIGQVWGRSIAWNANLVGCGLAVVTSKLVKPNTESPASPVQKRRLCRFSKIAENTGSSKLVWHYRRDATSREDATRMTTGDMGAVMAAITNLTLALIKQVVFIMPPKAENGSPAILTAL